MRGLEIILPRCGCGGQGALWSPGHATTHPAELLALCCLEWQHCCRSAQDTSASAPLPLVNYFIDEKERCKDL